MFIPSAMPLVTLVFLNHLYYWFSNLKILPLQNVKAFLRRGTAREMLLCYKEALQGENLRSFQLNFILASRPLLHGSNRNY